MGDEMVEPCPECGELTVVRKDNGVVECDSCGAIIFTPKELIADKIV